MFFFENGIFTLNNFYNPTLEGVESNPLINGDKKHGIYDVIPYYGSGNSDEDTTTGSQRFLRNIYLLNNKNK